MAGKYSSALGIDSEHRVQTNLSVTGISQWAISKAPAVLGGYLADRAYKAAVERFWDKEKSKWLPETVGTVGVLVAGFGIQYAGARFMPNSSHMLDKVTDGMCGRMSPAIMNTVKRLLGIAPAANAQAGVDGDDEAMRQVASLMAASPDFIDTLANGMVDQMRNNGADLSDDTGPELQRSMRSVARQLAKAA